MVSIVVEAAASLYMAHDIGATGFLRGPAD
jgi:hypothetical protein